MEERRVYRGKNAGSARFRPEAAIQSMLPRAALSLNDGVADALGCRRQTARGGAGNRGTGLAEGLALVEGQRDGGPRAAIDMTPCPTCHAARWPNWALCQLPCKPAKPLKLRWRYPSPVREAEPPEIRETPHAQLAPGQANKGFDRGRVG